MASGHVIDTYRSSLDPSGSSLGPPGAPWTRVRAPGGMDTNLAVTSATEPAMTVSELAAHRSVSTQALYGPRSKGRGSRGFRVGRQLRFRMSEIEAWPARTNGRPGMCGATERIITVKITPTVIPTGTPALNESAALTGDSS